jgi:hypothetical protein
LWGFFNMPEPKRIKCASGFGDAIYAYPIVRHLIESGKEEHITVMTDYHQIYDCAPFKDKLSFLRHSKDFAQYKISYCGRKYKAGTSQFQDVCMAAEVPTDLDFSIDWEIQNQDLINTIKKLARRKEAPICLISAPFKPFGRVDEFGVELTVNFKRMDDLIRRNRDKYFFVQVCKNVPEYALNNIDLNLAGKTTISDVLDIMSISDCSMGQIGHILPLSEVFKVPCLLFFSRKGLNCENRFISSITYDKIVHYKDIIKYCVDDETDVEIDRKWFETTN